ncbi:MAG TPA: methylthioribulose 1-phosphate dehydratase [Candidatus Angelobacter sp.]|jgi:methylthioribulose-1-phosphate dehydratase
MIRSINRRTSKTVTASADALISIGKEFYQRNWVLGTSGNFSVVLHRDPFELLVTESGVHKGMLAPQNFLTVGPQAAVISGSGKPSAETLIHISILGQLLAGCILHTHSVWSTLLTDLYGDSDGLEIEGYEMLKGLRNVSTHEYSEWIPILENSQNYDELALQISELLKANPRIHAVLLRRHGMYTWGEDILEAMRHVEILEFLFEVIGRKHTSGVGTR